MVCILTIKICNDMNILVLSSFFSRFYVLLADYLNSEGHTTTMHFVLLEENSIENNMPFVIVPDSSSILSDRNTTTIVDYVREHNIDVVLFPQLSNANTLVKQIKGIDEKIACLYLLHSCPNFVVADKKRQFKEMSLRSVTSIKKLLAYLLPNLYLFVLKQIWRHWARVQYDLYDKIIVLSHSYIEEYKMLMGQDDYDSKIKAVPNPLIYYQSNHPVHLKKKQIAFVGRFSLEKGVHRLIHVWKIVQSKLPDWNMVLVGDGPLKNQIENLAKDLCLERISFIGYTSSIPVIDESAIICLTSNIEGQPTVFMEAMQLGVVPIAFNSFSAINAMIDNEVNGVIVPAFDIQLYADKLVELASDEDKRCLMGLNAINKVKQYDISYVGRLWLSIFEALKIF